jgi:hypothetical protein
MGLKRPTKGHYNQGYFGNPPDKETLRYNIINGKVEECRRVTVHHFSLGDIEDPDLWAAEPLHNWETSEEGQWVMANAAEPPEWHRSLDYTIYGYKYIITAKFAGAKLTEWLLRYGNVV